MSEIKPRRYQEKAIKNFGNWVNKTSERLATIILPTGTGKTKTAIWSIKENPGMRILWAAHREELISQAYAEFTEMIPGLNVQVEMATSRAGADADVIVGSIQTLHRNRKNIQGFKPDLVVVDEWHHYDEKNKTYHGLMERYDAKFLGLTATPYRFMGGDLPLGLTLIEMDIGKAVRHNYLVPPIPTVLKTDVSLANVKTRAGDFAINELSAAVNVDDRNRLIAQHLIRAVKEEGRQGILYGVDVAHAKAMYDLLKNDVRAAEIYGETDKEERRETIGRIRNKEVDVVVNNLVLTEGTDLPHMSFICIARPTKSLGLYCLDLETEILTTNGWKKQSEICVGETAYGFDLNSKAIIKTRILNKIERRLYDNEYFIELNSPTLKFKVTNNHSLIYRNKQSKTFYKKPAETLLNRKSEFFVPISGVEKSPGINLSDDELRFIGWFLTDGTINKKTNQIVITQDVKQPYNKNIIECLKGCGFKYGKYTVTRQTSFKERSTINIYTISKGKPRGKDKHLTGWGRLEKYIDKNFSPELELITNEQLSVLLESIHFGDGSKQNGQSWTRRSYHIGTSNLIFAENLQSICVRRGFKCNLAQNHDLNRKGPFYILHIKPTQERMIGGKTYQDRKILSISKTNISERCWCVETEAGTIITRYHGFVTIMGNCQMMGRGLRLSPGKSDCQVIDVFDKVKITQTRITYSDVAAAGDLDGSQCRTESILKEKIADKLENFPVVISLQRGDRWTVDDSTWFAPAWMLADNQWVISWSKRDQRIDTGKFELVPFKFSPSNRSLARNPITVYHDKYGEGIAHAFELSENQFIDINNPVMIVDFNDSGTHHVSLSSLRKREVKYERKKLDKPIQRAFYICMTTDKKSGRMISLEQETATTYKVVDDMRADITTLNEMIKVAAEQDDMLAIVRKDAKWRQRPISEKQKQVIKNFISWGKVKDDLDLDSMTGGDASIVMDQVNWSPAINRLFGGKTQKDLIGYDALWDDV